MSLIVETGVGLSNAESYCSVAEATAYHAARGNTAWASLASDTVREQLLRKATDFMIQRYRSKWKGYRSEYRQALDFPRIGVMLDEFIIVESNIVPVDIKNACAELALRESTTEGGLSPDLSRVIIREKIAVIETEYDKSSPQSVRFKAVDDILAPYLKTSGSSTVRMARV